jgi:hypothetical protein
MITAVRCIVHSAGSDDTLLYSTAPKLRFRPLSARPGSLWHWHTSRPTTTVRRPGFRPQQALPNNKARFSGRPIIRPTPQVFEHSRSGQKIVWSGESGFWSVGGGRSVQASFEKEFPLRTDSDQRGQRHSPASADSSQFYRSIVEIVKS